MAKSPNQKLKLLILREILLEETDQEYPLTADELIARLAQRGVGVERKALYDDLEALRTFGLDVVSQRGRTYGYFVGERDFELPELKLLVDAVQASKFITHRKSNQLIKKLERLTSRHQAGQLQRHVYVYDRVKTPNERIYLNVDAIHEAIAGRKKISFRYYDYGPDKVRRPRQEGAPYVVSPYALCWQEENYYLIAHYPKYGGISNFRVDRMQDTAVLEEPAQNIREVTGTLDLNVALYTKGVFGMYHGRVEQVTVRFHNSLMGVVIDRFGEEVDTARDGEEHFQARLEVHVSPTFYGWLMMFGDKARVLGPRSVLDELSALAGQLSGMYPPNSEESQG